MAMANTSPEREQRPKSPQTTEIEHNFLELRQKIRPLFEILGKTPKNELERFLASEVNTTVENVENINGIINVKIDGIVLQKTETLYNEFIKEYAQLKTEIDGQLTHFMDRIRHFQEKEDMILGYTAYHLDIKNLISQLEKKCSSIEERKFSRLKLCILELRTQILNIWNECHIAEEDRANLQIEMTTENFTEFLWETLKVELTKWKVYQEKNRALFEKVKQRDGMWVKLRELDARSRDPNRFKNRGGTLLKDQSDMNALLKDLPKLETQLKRLAVLFEKEHGKHVSINGKTIGEMIDEDWAQYKEGHATTRGRQTQRDKNTSLLLPTPKLGERPASNSTSDGHLDRIKRLSPTPAAPASKNLPRRSISLSARGPEKRPAPRDVSGNIKRKCLEY